MRAWQGLPAVAAFAAAVAAAGASTAAEMHDDRTFVLLEADRLEYRLQDGDDLLAWDGQLRVFNDDHGLTFLAEGEYARGDDVFETVEFQALYQRPVSDFWDIRGGVRQDVRPLPMRTFAVIGLSGLAPQFLEVDASAFVSHRGDVSLRGEAEVDLRLTQRLVLQPALELDVALTDDRATGVGAGFSKLETGLRLRYEIDRRFAPYIGISHERSLMRTADFARADGEDTAATAFVAGLHFFF